MHHILAQQFKGRQKEFVNFIIRFKYKVLNRACGTRYRVKQGDSTYHRYVSAKNWNSFSCTQWADIKISTPRTHFEILFFLFWLYFPKL